MTISSRRHRISSYDRSERSGSIAVAAIIAMMTAIYAVWSWLQPISLDDIGFSARYMKANGGSTSLNLGALWQFASDQWIAENGRLSNIVSPIFSVVLPRLATSLLAAMAIAAMVTLIAKLMEPERRLSPWRLATVWTVCIVAYPWHDAMLLIDYTLNYPVACMLQLALLWYVWRLNNGWGPKPPACAALTLLAVAAGWIHEGFSIPMCCGLAVMTVLRKGRVEGTLWLMIAAYLCGTAVAILSPGLWFRAAHVGHSSALPTVRQIARTAATGMPAVIALTVAVTAMSMSRRWRGRISDLLQSNPVAVILAGAIPVSSALSAWTLSPRGGWMAETGAIILAGCLCRWLPKPSRAVRMSVTLFLLAAIATFYGNVISWQYRIKTQDDRLSLLAAESATGTIYYSEPLIVPPPITLGHPYSRFWRNSEVSAERRVADPLHRPISAIPAPLADYDPAQTEPVEGNAGTFYFRDYLLNRVGRETKVF